MANPLIVAFLPQSLSAIAFNILHAGWFFIIFCCLLYFFKNNFFQKKLFQEYHQDVDILDPNQAWQFVNPDLGPNRLQSL